MPTLVVAMRRLIVLLATLLLLSACADESAVEVAEEQAREELGCAAPRGRNLGNTFPDEPDDVAVLITGCTPFQVVYRCCRSDFGRWACRQTNSPVG